MTETTRGHRQLGQGGPMICPLALGCMGMSDMYGPADERESIATIHEALDRSVTLLDTGDFYGMGHNELLIGRALQGRREQAQLVSWQEVVRVEELGRGDRFGDRVLCACNR